MKKSNRVVSFLLALTLVTGLMPADAFTFTAYATAQDGKPADGTLTNGEVTNSFFSLIFSRASQLSKM